jgi:hypothetical protein
MTYGKVNTKPLLCNLELLGGIAVSQESEDRDDIHYILHCGLLQHSYIHSLTGVADLEQGNEWRPGTLTSNHAAYGWAQTVNRTLGSHLFKCN